MANHIAKKNTYFNGVCNLIAMDYCAIEGLHETIGVSEIWDVGRKHTQKLNSLNIYSVLGFVMASPLVIRDEVSKIATKMIDDLYQQDVGFKKCGVILTCLKPKINHTYDLFIDMKQITAGNKLMDSLEVIHHKFGKTKLTFGASMLPNRTWNISRDQLSQNYFRWDQLLCVK